MLPAKRLERLRTLGLPEYQARAYLALLELGPSLARAVAGRSGVPRGKVYATLNDLHARGLVSVTPERPHRYVAAPVVELLAALRRRHREALERLTRDEQALVREFAGRRSETAAPLGSVVVVRGRRNALDRIRGALARAEREAVLLLTGPGLTRLADDLDDLADARERGVRVLVRAPLEEAEPGPVAAVAAIALLEDAPPPAGDVGVVLVDGVTAVLHRAVPDDARLYRGEDLAVLVEDAHLAAALRAMARVEAEAEGEEQEERLELS